MPHPQVFSQKFTPICRFLAWKTHPFWPHIPNMTQYGSAPRGSATLALKRGLKILIQSLKNNPKNLSILANITPKDLGVIQESQSGHCVSSIKKKKQQTLKAMH